MSAPRWARWLLGRLAPEGREDEILGDLEEAHRGRRARRGAVGATLLTSLEALDMAAALLRTRSPVGRISLLDFKLALRMLTKHPGLTTLGGLSMAFAIFVGAGAFEFASQVARPTLPLPDGDRLVGFRLYDAAESRGERRALFELGVWRQELGTVEELGAYRSVERNLITEDGLAEPVSAAQIDAAGFGVARVPPLLGRPLIEDDARPGAPAVVVIGHRIWKGRFGADPDVVGTTVRLGDTPTTVVGVMPEGFGFPVAHEMWVPFDTRGTAWEPRSGPGVMVFGRLAPGASLDEARAELRVLGDRIASAHPATHEHLRPQVLPYALAAMGMPASFSSLLLATVGLASNVPLILFVVLVCGNVALLLFARAASREGELVVRSALGASRARIVAQLFAEALVLASLAAVFGLAAAQYGLRWVFRITESIVLEGDPLPFWFHASLSPTTLVYSAALVLLGATVAGVLPGLKVTRDLGSRLQRTSAGGGGGFRFGGIWTGVIAAQIAVTMVFPILVRETRAQSDQELAKDLDFPAHQYLSARLEMDRSTVAGAPADSAGTLLDDRFRVTAESLAERLRSEPRVAGVAFAERLPRQYHGWRQVEVDGPTAEPRDERGHRLGSSAVSLDYFDVMGVDVLAGRGFQPADLTDGPGVVVVNQSFVERILGGRNAVGQRVRYLASEEYRDPSQDPGPWHEIVGVVEDFGTISGYGPQGMYHPAAVGEIHPVHVAVRVSGEPRAFAPILRSVAAGVEPNLRLDDLITLDEVTRGQREFFAFWTTILLAGCGMALLLSLGGIFAVMSFTVARRTREIGIRVALGSNRARVVLAVFHRPLVQVVIGVLSGGVLLALLFVGLSDTMPDPASLVMLVAYMAVMTAVCLLACIVPTARALSVEPSDALRVD